MNRERDIERVLDAWLQPGPTVMPDRLFDDVLERIERQPQRRLARLQLRITTMRPVTILAVAAAITVAVGAGLFLLGRPSTSDVAAPTAAPSIAPAPSASAAPSATPAAALPPELAHVWIGAPRALPLSGRTDPVLLKMEMGLIGTATQVLADLGGNWLFGSRASVPEPGTLHLETKLANGGCDVGAVGEYTYTMSPDGRTLDLAAIDEPCPPRAEVYGGTWSLRECNLPANPDGWVCAGSLPAGTHASTFFDPWSSSREMDSVGAYGALRFTVPDGWANSEDVPTSFFLTPSEEYAKDDGGDLESWHGIYIRRAASAMAQDEQCTNAEQPGVPRTLEGLTQWLVDHPGLVASTPVETTIGGKRATMTDTVVAPDWTTTCPDATGGHPVAHMFREADTGRWDWSAGWPGNQDRQRVILVELAPENVMLVALDDTISQASFDALVAEAMPIVESFEFPE